MQNWPMESVTGKSRRTVPDPYQLAEAVIHRLQEVGAEPGNMRVEEALGIVEIQEC